ncbi:MAG TPA: hypothetical protein PLC27_04595 [Saprospiraceae bacterium]|nr:hypothetical protein [Saprospiraceae bacterium]
MYWENCGFCCAIAAKHTKLNKDNKTFFMINKLEPTFYHAIVMDIYRTF